MIDAIGVEVEPGVPVEEMADEISHWKHLEVYTAARLVSSDAADYFFPAAVSGIRSTFALTLDTADIYKRAGDLGRTLRLFFLSTSRLSQVCNAARQEVINSTAPKMASSLLTWF